jgi:hypothetical protein
MNRAIVLAAALWGAAVAGADQGGTAAETLAVSPYGVGLIISDRSGFNAKLQSRTHALEFVLSFDAPDDYVYFHGDFIVQDVRPVPDGSLTGLMNTFWGFGLRADTPLRQADRTELGVRLVFGAAYVLKELPYEIFAHIAPTVNVAPSFSVFLAPGLGVRYLFR